MPARVSQGASGVGVHMVPARMRTRFMLPRLGRLRQQKSKAEKYSKSGE
jgi:hypothetical protein